jgi:hypothetical protein
MRRSVPFGLLLLCSMPLTHPELGPQSSEILAARIELLAQRAGVGGALDEGAIEYLLMPSHTVRGSGEVTRYLATLPKPVACLTSASEGRLALTCESITDPTELEIHRRTSEAASGVLNNYIHKLARNEHPLVELRGRGETLVVDVATLHRWIRDYIGLGYTLEGLGRDSFPDLEKPTLVFSGRTVGAEVRFNASPE